MARPRVFISSTFYDLRQVRTELERFIKEQGYESVLHERGQVTYGKEQKLEEYCYKEIQQVDMLVSIIGGRYGSESASHEGKSISQAELATAIKQNKQVYIFVEKAVHAEHGTYQANKDNTDTKYKHVDNRRVYQFLDEVYALTSNNQVAPFEVAHDITGYLKEQWAGLFQGLLQDNSRREELSVISELRIALQTTKDIVTFLTAERKNAGDAVSRIVQFNHPMFGHLRNLLKVGHRVFFTSHQEMVEWLVTRGFIRVQEDAWDDKQYEEFIRRGPRIKTQILKVHTGLFANQGAVVYHGSDWVNGWIVLAEPAPKSEFDDDFNAAPADDDIPF